MRTGSRPEAEVGSAAPERAVPDRAVPDRAVPDRTVPGRTVPGQKAPDRTASERAWDLVRELISGGEMVERMGRLAKETRLSPGTVKALQRLRREHYPSMRDVARGLGCDPSYVTGLVDELAGEGLVERQAHPDDRRIKTVVLTADGMRVADQVERVLGVPPSSFEALSEAEAQQLSRILAKVVAAGP